MPLRSEQPGLPIVFFGRLRQRTENLCCQTIILGLGFLTIGSLLAACTENTPDLDLIACQAAAGAMHTPTEQSELDEYYIDKESAGNYVVGRVDCGSTEGIDIYDQVKVLAPGRSYTDCDIRHLLDDRKRADVSCPVKNSCLSLDNPFG